MLVASAVSLGDVSMNWSRRDRTPDPAACVRKALRTGALAVAVATLVQGIANADTLVQNVTWLPASGTNTSASNFINLFNPSSGTLDSVAISVVGSVSATNAIAMEIRKNWNDTLVEASSSSASP